MTTRRHFLAILPAAALAAVRPTGLRAGRRARVTHPDPRPGIDAAEVMTADAVAAFGDEVVGVYDMVREMPHIADGIGCACGCAALPNYRSLLTCYYATGMAMGCAICQGEAKLAYRRFKEGQTLEQIRRAIDARFG
jgi:hypothetical protein